MPGATRMADTAGFCNLCGAALVELQPYSIWGLKPQRGEAGLPVEPAVPKGGSPRPELVLAVAKGLYQRGLMVRTQGSDPLWDGWGWEDGN